MMPLPRLTPPTASAQAHQTEAHTNNQVVDSMLSCVELPAQTYKDVELSHIQLRL